MKKAILDKELNDIMKEGKYLGYGKPDEQEFLRRNSFSKLLESSASQLGIDNIINNQGPYLTSILALTEKHLPLLKSLKEEVIIHLSSVYGISEENDDIKLFFHFPYSKSTITLHLHIRINQKIYPIVRDKMFLLDDIIHHLEKGKDIDELILAKKQFYTPSMEIVSLSQKIGAEIKHYIDNPHYITLNPTLEQSGISAKYDPTYIK